MRINKKSPLADQSIKGTSANNTQFDYSTYWQDLIEESQRLTREYKRAEYLKYKADNIFDRDELDRNMLDIQSKLDDLKLEADNITILVNDMISQGVLI